MDRQDAGQLGRRTRSTATSAHRTVADGSLTADVLGDRRDLLVLREDWDRLHAATGALHGDAFNPFTSWAWMWHWWESRADGSWFDQPRYELRVSVFRDRDGVVRAIVPFVRARWGLGRLAVRATRLFGFGPCTTDLRAPLVWPGWETAAADALTDHLRESGGTHHDLSIVDGVPEFGAFTQRLVARADQEGWSWGPVVPSHVVSLGESWEAFRAGFKGHLKKSVRHGYNSLARDGHAWSFDLELDPGRIHEAIDDVFRLHALRAAPNLKPRHVDYYAKPRDREAIRAVAGSLVADGAFAVARLRVADEVVAARFVFVGDRAIYLHDAGADPAWAPYAVATTLTAECLRWGIERGMAWAHLGTGDDPSKARWQGHARSMRRLQVVAPTLAGRLLAMAQHLPRIARWVSLGVAPVFGDMPIEALP